MVHDESGLENGVGIARKISNAFVEGVVENGRPVGQTGGRAVFLVVVSSKRGGQHFVGETDELHSIVGGETVRCAAVGVVLFECRGGVEFGRRRGEGSGNFG